MKIQVGPASQVKDSPFNKFLWFLTKILLVPAERNSVGEYKFRILSWRYFFSWLVWSFLSSSATIFIFSAEIRNILTYLGSTQNFDQTAELLFYQTKHAFDIMILYATPVCLGYLVNNYNIEKKCLILPSRKIEILLYTISYFITGLLGTLETEDKTKVVTFIELGILIFTTVVTMILYNTLITNFVENCKKIKELPFEAQGDAMKQILVEYAHLKVGLGPTAMIWHIYIIVYLVAISYNLAISPTLPMGIILISFTIQIWNISACCQEAYYALQSAGQVLR